MFAICYSHDEVVSVHRNRIVINKKNGRKHDVFDDLPRSDQRGIWLSLNWSCCHIIFIYMSLFWKITDYIWYENNVIMVYIFKGKSYFLSLTFGMVLATSFDIVWPFILKTNSKPFFQILFKVPNLFIQIQLDSYELIA